MAGTVHAEEPATAALLGMRTRAYRFQPVQQIKLETDFTHRVPSHPQVARAKYWPPLFRQSNQVTT